MKFLVDECTGPGVAEWLASKGFEIVSVFNEMRGASDIQILEHASKNGFVLITNDKDFGELVFKLSLHHKGIILLRLHDQRLDNKIKILDRLIDSYGEDIESSFIVVTETSVRIQK